MSDAVLREPQGRTLVNTINRPEARNAVNLAVSQGFADAADELDSDRYRTVAVVTGAGGHFCSGMNLEAVAFAENRAPDWTGT